MWFSGLYAVVDVVHLIRHARTFSVQILFGFSSVFAVNQIMKALSVFNARTVGTLGMVRQIFERSFAGG